jgi:hypothetical protein
MKYWSLFNLDIIGFASVLESPTLPRVLAPVFRDRNQPEMVLLPPFSLVADEVFNATPVPVSELEALAIQKRVTAFGEPLRAKLNHDLWVDADGFVAYEPKAVVKSTFGDIFTKHLALAEERLAAKDYTGAGQHAAIARAVKPSHLDPLVIRAAAERLSGQHAQVSFTRHIAADYVSAGEFERLVDARTGGELLAENRGATVMKGIAVRKPRSLPA